MKTKLIYKQYIILALLVLTSLSSCQLIQKMSKDKTPAPEWVTNRPQNRMYYIGIGSSPKKGKQPADYMAKSQQKALSDMASGISVKIESTSVLSVMENQYDINENFSSAISSSSNEKLEGYELVDKWENSDYYWTYYRLKKSKYKEIKLKKKEQKISEAKNKYYQAKKLIDKNMHYNAFKFYVDALTTLKPYLGESTKTEIDGEEKDLGNEIFAEIASFMNNLKIVFPTKQINVKKGVILDNDAFYFTITDKQGNNVSDIPVRIDFTGKGLLRSSETSGNEGKVFCSINKVKSLTTTEKLKVSIDAAKLARIAQDHVIRSIIKKIPTIEKMIYVVVEKPFLNIGITEKIFSDTVENLRLKDSFERLLSKDFYVNESETPDFFISANFNTSKKGKVYAQKQVVLTYTIELTDKNKNLIYRKTKSEEYSGKDYKTAANEAYIDVIKSIERFVVAEIVSNINK